MAYVDELIEKGERIRFNFYRKILTDRMGDGDEQNVKLAFVGRVANKGPNLVMTRDEVEELFSKGLTENVVRGEDGMLHMIYIHCVASFFPGAIVCGVLAPSAKAELRSEIFEYAKKMGYIADEMTPVKMISGTKSLIFNADGTYNIFYSWYESVFSNIDRNVLEEFTKDCFKQCMIEIKSDGVLIKNLSEDEAFSRKNINHFRAYDIQLKYLSKEYDKEVLLYALMKTAIIYGPYFSLGRRDFEKLGNIEIPINRFESLAFNEFGNIQMSSGKLVRYEEPGYYDYIYHITIPYSEAIRELMVDTVKLLKARLGEKIPVIFSGFNEWISVSTNDVELTSLIERELLALDYAIDLWKNDAQFIRHELRCAILSMLEADSTGVYQKAYHTNMSKFKNALPEKFKNI